MSPASTLPETEPRRSVRRPTDPARPLYAAVAALLLVITFVGFQQFYLHGRAYPAHEMPPPIKGLLMAHGLLMTGWMVLFLVQSLLIVGGNRRLHMSLGWVGTVLAAGIVILGVRTPIATTRVEPDIVLWGLHRKQFTAIPINIILLFGVFVAVGVWQRRRPEIHRPMMLLGTLGITTAAADRITGLPGLYASTVWGTWFGPFFPILVIGAVFLVVKSVLARSFDRWFALGYAVLSVACAAIMAVAPTPFWDRVISHLIR